MSKAKSTELPPERYAYPFKEGCHKLGIGRTLAYALKNQGKLKTIKIAGRTLIPHSEVLRLTRVPEEV